MLKMQLLLTSVCDRFPSLRIGLIVIWSFLVFPLVHAVGEQERSTMYTLEKAPLRLTLNVDTHTYHITDMRTDRTWRTAPVVPELRIEAVAAVDDTSMRLELYDEAIDASFSCVLTLENPGVLHFTINADEDISFADSSMRSYPPAPRADLESGYLSFCDRSCGVLIPLDDEVYGGKYLHIYGNTQCLDMPWIGLTEGRSGDGLMVYVHTPFDAGITLAPDDSGKHWPQITWLPSMQTFRYPRSVSYRFIDDGGYVTLAKKYRAILKSDNRFKTLAEKAEKIPNVNLLHGAPVIWGNLDAWEFVLHMRNVAGMDRAIIGNAHHGLKDQNSLRRLNEMGYITTAYDSIGDILEGETAFQRDDVEKTAYHWEPGAGPAKGWRTLEGLQYYFRSSAYAMDALKSYVPQHLERYGFNSRFMDVAVAITLFEDYHPEHTFDRRQDMRYRRETYEYFRELGLVIGTEHGNDWCVELIDYFEGATSGPLWWETDRFAEGGWNAGHLRNPTDRSQLPEVYLKYGMGYDYRIPLWDLVYHDSAGATWYWGDTAGFMYRVAPDLADQKDLYNMLHGTVPLLWRNDTQGYRWSDDEERARFIKTYQQTCRLHAIVSGKEMLNHEVLSDDSALQRTTFEGGTVVVVNFSNMPRTYTHENRDYELAPFGYYIVGPGLTQTRLMDNDAAVTLIKADDFVQVVTEASQKVEMVHGKGSITLFKGLDDGYWRATLEANSQFNVDVQSLTGHNLSEITLHLVDPLLGVTEPVNVHDEDQYKVLPVSETLATYAFMPDSIVQQ